MNEIRFRNIHGGEERLLLDEVESSVFNADCMELLRALPDKCIDLAIVDPPYGIRADGFKMLEGKGDHPKGATAATVDKMRNRLSGAGVLKGRLLNRSDTSWDNTPPRKEYFDELFRVSKDQVIWGGNYFDLPPTRCFVMWDKRQPWPNFSQAEYAWTSFDRPSKVFALSNCIRGRIHPTQKPIRLYEFLLEQFGSKGELVLDTHLGSGSSRIAARNLGFRFIGTEKDEYYFSEEERRWMSLPTAIEKEREEGGQMYLFDEDMEEDER